jgi:NAD(P)-dependent dehydrogenase (short-subunit alcohol dehydrogenase family)
MLTVNLQTTFALARAAVPGMLRAGRGWVVAVASRAAAAGQAGAAAYAASKAGLVALMASLAEEVRGRGINVNTVVPGTIDTAANRHAMPEADPRAWTPPADLARVIRFLCSEDARAIHGAAIPVLGAR